jgi:hypothetical protein
MTGLDTERQDKIVAIAIETSARQLEMTQDYYARMARPSMFMKPKLWLTEGKGWCAMYGPDHDPDTYVCGYGDSPDEAYLDFDRAWCLKGG